MTTTRYPEADTQDTLWPEDRIETLLTAGCFDAEPAGERYARLLGADAPGKGSGADSPTIHLWLGCRCAGWAEPPSGEEFTPRSARLSRAGGRSQSSTPGRTRRRGPRHCRPGRSTPTRCASWRRRCTGRDWPDAGSPRPSTGGRRTATSPNHERRTAAVARAGRHTVDENPGTAEASPGEPRRTNGAEARRLDRAEVDGRQRDSARHGGSTEGALRPFVPEDAEAVYAYRRDPGAMRFTRRSRPVPGGNQKNRRPRRDQRGDAVQRYVGDHLTTAINAKDWKHEHAQRRRT